MSRKAANRRGYFRSRRGSALLAVIWLSIALSAIAFTLARTVRGELDRASINVDSTRAYFLARGGIERTVLRMTRPLASDADPAAFGFRRGQRWMRLDFPEGNAVVEIIGESGKLNVNSAPPEAIARVLTSAGLSPAFSTATAGRIVDARSPSQQQLLDPTGAPTSSLSRRRASFDQLEELLVLPGITPEVLFGKWGLNRVGEWTKIGGLHRHLSVFGGTGVDANYASPEVLRAAGLGASAISSLLETRDLRPLQPQDLGPNQMADQRSLIPVTATGGGAQFTLWSRATLFNGRARRAVGALVEKTQTTSGPPIRIVRWYDSEF